MDGQNLIEKLIIYAKCYLHLESFDEPYIRNLLLREFKLSVPGDFLEPAEVSKMDVPDELVQSVAEYAKENGLAEEEACERYATYIFGLLTPMPSVVNHEYARIKSSGGINAALNYFYSLCVKNNYVQKTAIARNIAWDYNDGANKLEITINLSKPEKDNKEIAKLLKKPTGDKYPKCMLCRENLGFEGGPTHPARGNIRTIDVKLAGENWFVQYSPYAYYEEHCIAISYNHVPMVVDPRTVTKLFDFVELFPTYFIGSNASLPIIGGSILNHEHFQGGKHILPMQLAKIEKEYYSPDYPAVKIGIVDWYNSAIRLTSESRESMERLAAAIILSWRGYSDEKCTIQALTDGVLHNSLSPVARKVNGMYVLDMILRNNLTSEQYPDGIFHAHPEYHNIKKEGIGLIEAMGLFILPGRLKKQTAAISDILCGETPYSSEELNKESNPLYIHRNMIAELYAKTGITTREKADKEIELFIGNVCANILDNTAVFKRDKNGREGFDKFMKKLGFISSPLGCN